MIILEVKNLSKKFGGVHAVDSLNLSFEKGKLTGIVGPNGSGKSTLVALLSGVLAFDKGTVVIQSEHFSKLSASEIAELGITRTFQEVRLIEQISVLDNILLVTTKRGVFESIFEKHSKLHHEKAETALKQVGLWEKRNALGNELSYGQRKLLEIARVLAMDAEILLFDEPFAGLSKIMVAQVGKILENLREQGKTTVLIEHNMELIRKLSDHLIVLDAGKLLEEGEPKKVLEKREVIEAYLGE